jgi:hypothetical protein
MPRAYWLFPEKQILTSTILLIQPTEAEFGRVMTAVGEAGPSDYDMEILNRLYRDSALVLPHRPYTLLTRTFRGTPEERANYLGGDDLEWDPVAVLTEAKYLHFSDWPIPKPWLPMPAGMKAQFQPKCSEVDGVESCVESDLWNGFYDDFHVRRMVRFLPPPPSVLLGTS